METRSALRSALGSAQLALLDRVSSAIEVVEDRLLSSRAGAVAQLRDASGERFLVKVSPETGDAVNEVRCERQVLDRLGGEYAARIFGFADDGSAAALLLRWVDGHSLGTMLEEQGADVSRQAELIEASRAAVGELHRRGVVHADIQPAHLRISGDTVRVIDFGVAGAAGSEYGGALVHFTTPANAARLSEGRKAIRSVDADWYAFAASVFFAVAGRHPVLYEQSDPLQEKFRAIAARRYRQPAGPELADRAMEWLQRLAA